MVGLNPKTDFRSRVKNVVLQKPFNAAPQNGPKPNRSTWYS